jgi:hypothetical protein
MSQFQTGATKKLPSLRPVRGHQISIHYREFCIQNLIAERASPNVRSSLPETQNFSELPEPPWPSFIHDLRFGSEYHKNANLITPAE